MNSTIFIAALLSTAAPAGAQRLSFERSFDIKDQAILDVSTERGKIDVTVGAPSLIVIVGTVTIRTDWDVPANAPELARQVADHPPIELEGNTARLRPPVDAEERRAVTVSYQVRVPLDTQVRSLSDSGATSVSSVSGPVVVRTQSGAIELTRLGGDTEVASGSGSVSADDVAGGLTVTTMSSGFTGRSLRSSLHVRTASGAVDAALVGTGDVNVETGSSSIALRGVKAGLTASTRSGRLTVRGTPGAPWIASTGSGSIDVALEPVARIALEATSGSGSVKVAGASLQGLVTKRHVVGTIGGGGPVVRLTSRSGSIRITVTSDRDGSSPVLP